MVYLKYKNLDDLYYNFSRLPFYQHNKYKDFLFDVFDTTTWMQDVVLEVPSHKCSIDMSLLNYTKAKWNTLLGKYLDIDEYLSFKEQLKKCTRKSIVYNFKIHTYNKPACLIAMVLTRFKHTGPFRELKILYRSTEMFKKFAVDLILFNRLIEEFNNECGCKIERLNLFIPLLFFRADFLAELLGSKYFPLEEFRKIKNNRFCDKVMYYHKRYYTKGASLANYHTIARKQKLKQRADPLPKIPIESLAVEKDLALRRRKK